MSTKIEHCQECKHMFVHTINDRIYYYCAKLQRGLKDKFPVIPKDCPSYNETAFDLILKRIDYQIDQADHLLKTSNLSDRDRNRAWGEVLGLTSLREFIESVEKKESSETDKICVALTKAEAEVLIKYLTSDLACKNYTKEVGTAYTKIYSAMEKKP